MDTKSASIIGASLIISALIISLTPKDRSAELEVGRFQMSGVPGHAFVIDTFTGKVWQKYATTHQGSTSPDFLNPKLNNED